MVKNQDASNLYICLANRVPFDTKQNKNQMASKSEYGPLPNLGLCMYKIKY